MLIRKSELSEVKSSYDYVKELVSSNITSFKPATREKLTEILAKKEPTIEDKSYVMDCIEYGKG